MATYTLHTLPNAEWGDARALDRAVVVKDGFTWGAFVFTFLWFFANRLWLAGLLVLVAQVGLGVAAALLNVSPGAAVLAEALLAFLVGLEASSLKRWTLARRGRPAVDVVSGSSRSDAEFKAFARWLADPGLEPRPSRSPPPPLPPGSAPTGVIGLFPEAERRR